MANTESKSRLTLLVVIFAFGGMLLFVPPWIAGQVETATKLGPVGYYAYLGVVALGGLLLLGATGAIVWRLVARTRHKQAQRVQRGKNPSELSLAEREQELNENLSTAQDLQAELPEIDNLHQQLKDMSGRIAEKRERETLEIVAFGSISSGKSSLLNALAGREVFQTDAKGGTTLTRNDIPWPGADRVTLVDTPGLGEIDGTERGKVSADAAKDADLVLMVVDGPLRAWEFELLRQLTGMEKRVLLCLNKADWYTEKEMQSLLGQLRQQVGEIVDARDVLTVRAQATKRTRVRVYSDGSQGDEEVDVPADISPLATRMLEIVRRDSRELLLANLLLQSRGLVDEARRRVEQALDTRAWEIVEKYMWGAGGAAALSPIPVLDLAAGVAISTKMVIDLGRVYRQDIDMNAAVTLLGQLVKQLLTILGINAVGPAIASAVGSLLKAVPGVGTVAGGLLQGIVQAIITRWIGAVFIRYFKGEMQLPSGGLATLARQEWQRLTTLDELRRLVQSARSKLV